MREQVPAPQAHLRGTLRTFDRFAALAGGHPSAGAVRALCARPLGTGRAERGDENSLKYDLYLSRQESGLAWGAALNDRWEGLRLDSDVASLASRSSGNLFWWE